MIVEGKYKQVPSNNASETIKKWHNEFSALNFYDRNNPNSQKDSNSAIALITEKQVINMLCNGTGDGCHRDSRHLVSAVLQEMNFTCEIKDLPPDERKKIYDFAQRCIQLIMMNEKHSYDCFVVFPLGISPKQFFLFEKYMRKLDEELSGYLKTLNLEDEGLLYFSDLLPRTNDINTVINYASTRVNLHVPELKENIILGDTLMPTEIVIPYDSPLCRKRTK